MLVDRATAVYVIDPRALAGLKLGGSALNPWYTAALFWYQCSK
jgi:hypothetical protein